MNIRESKMKAMDGYTAGIRSRIFLWVGFLWLVFMMNSSAQENPIPGQNNVETALKAKKDYTIRGQRAEWALADRHNAQDLFSIARDICI